MSMSNIFTHLGGCRRRFSSASWLPLSIPLVSLLLWAATLVYASDCPPNDPSRSDCQAAANTARSPLVPLAGAVVGVFVNGVFRGETRLCPPSGNATDDKEKEEIYYTLDIRTQDKDGVARLSVSVDGEDVLWIYAQIQCSKAGVDTSAATQSIAFSVDGPNREWIILGEATTVRGYKVAPIRAWPPDPEAEFQDGMPVVVVSAMIENQVLRVPVDITLGYFRLTVRGVAEVDKT